MIHAKHGMIMGFCRPRYSAAMITDTFRLHAPKSVHDKEARPGPMSASGSECVAGRGKAGR